MTIRLANQQDLTSIADIYNQGIRARSSTFETRERTADDIRTWLEHPDFPLLVADKDGHVLGWIHASSYRARECYKGIAEFSVYIDENARGQGIGSILMTAFLDACEKAGFWKVLSRIFPENTASRALCKKYGFREVGLYDKHAKLDGVWRDVIIVEKLLASNLI